MIAKSYLEKVSRVQKKPREVVHSEHIQETLNPDVLYSTPPIRLGWGEGGGGEKEFD